MTKQLKTIPLWWFTMGLILVWKTNHILCHEKHRQTSVNLHRVIRSPQLLSGRNPLSDFAPIKPLTLNDVTELRQKMLGNFNNLTVMFEQAIAIERAAREALQMMANSLKGKILGMQASVNPDSENFWSESKECGGILISQTGKISYRLKDYYNNNDKCVWTVRANYRSKIKVTLTAAGLEESHDYVSVTEFKKGTNSYGSQWTTKRLVVGQVYIFDGPVILISFIADGSVHKQGFHLEYEGIGINTLAKAVYQHFHFTQLEGQFDSANLSESLTQNDVKLEKGFELKVTMVINPVTKSASKVLVDVPETGLDLRPEQCQKTDLAILTDIPAKPFGTSSGCCARFCESYNFSTPNRVVLGILTSSDVTEGSSFQINWSTEPMLGLESVDSCGGILRGNFGKILYKPMSKYDNHERCLWAIYPEKLEDAEIKLHLLKDGFEHQYDFITASYFKADENGSNLETKFLYKAGHPVNIPSSFLFLEFYADSATFGRTTGFELTWEVKYTTGTPLSIEMEYNNADSGTKTIDCLTYPANGILYQFHIFNPHFVDGNELFVEIGSGTNSVSAFQSGSGKFTKIQDLTPSSTHQSKDGVFILMKRCSAQESSTESSSISWRKVEDHVDENTVEDKVKAKSVDKCGEVLVADSGQISYKLGKEYNLNERCTWVIQSKSLSTITVQLMGDGFESCCDGLRINQLNVDGTIDPNVVAISREHRYHTFSTPVLYVMFFSDHSVKGTGFTLEFQTKGKQEDIQMQIKHVHISLPELKDGQSHQPITIHSSSNSLTIYTIPFETEEEDPQIKTVSVRMQDMKTDTCTEDSLVLYHMPTITEYSLLTQYPNPELCSLTPLSRVYNTAANVTDGKLTAKGALIVGMKIKEANANKQLTLSFE